MLRPLFLSLLVMGVSSYSIKDEIVNPSNWSPSAKWLGFTGSMVGGYWCVTQLHAYYCAPSGFYGMIQTALLMSSPVCRTFVSIMSNIDSIYGAVWGGLFLSSMSFLSDISKKFSINTQKVVD